MTALLGVVVLLLATPPLRVAANWAAGGALPGLNSGRIWSVAVSPGNPNLVVAGTDNGVYLSGDGATTWKSVTLSGTRVWVVGFDVRDPKHVLAGTAGQGMRTSSDGGATWSDDSSGLPNRNVRSLAFSLSQIAAGTDNGVAVSTDGTKWARGGLDGISISALTVVQNSPNVTLIAGTDLGDLSQGSLWVNNGSAWQANRGSGLPDNSVVLSLASGPVSQAVTRRPIVVDTNQGTFRTLDSGSTWAPATNLPEVGTSTLTLTTSAISPLDPNLVYSGADAAGSTGGAMMRSTDSGVTYSDAAQGLSTTSKNVVSIAIAPTTPPTLYIAVDPVNSGGSIYKLTDTSAPVPPALVPESPGASIPAAVGTPTPAVRATPGVSASPPAAPAKGVGAVIGTVLHWPTPLVYELIVILLGIYGYLRWRQRHYIEGPP